MALGWLQVSYTNLLLKVNASYTRIGGLEGAENEAEPECAGFERKKQIENAPHLTKEGVAGSHSKAEEAGDGCDLLEVKGTHMPAKAARMAIAEVPGNSSGEEE